MIGYEFLKSDKIFWRKHFRALIPLSMPNVVFRLTEIEAKKLLKINRSLFIRWDTHFDNLVETSWWHIIKDEKEDITKLNKKARNQIRRGDKNFEIRVVKRDYIIECAYLAYRVTFETYNTIERYLIESEFQVAVKNLPKETEFWGVFDRKTEGLVGFSENLVRDEACFYMSIWVLPEAMKRYASYILFHEMNKYYLNDCQLRYVSDGARSISHATKVHDFLQSKFGFRKAYSKLNVVYSDTFGILISIAYPFRRLLKRLPGKLFQKASILLFQEEIRRSCETKDYF